MSEREMLSLCLKHIWMGFRSILLHLTQPLIDCCTLFIMFYLFSRNCKGITDNPCELYYSMYSASIHFAYSTFITSQRVFYNASATLSQNTERPYKHTEKLLCTRGNYSPLLGLFQYCELRSCAHISCSSMEVSLI